MSKDINNHIYHFVQLFLLVGGHIYHFRGTAIVALWRKHGYSDVNEDLRKDGGFMTMMLMTMMDIVSRKGIKCSVECN